nr:ABC transporter permease [Treponema sp.]
MKFKNNLSWVYYVAKRFSLVDLKGAGAFTSRLSTLGICFGVMTLIIVISVMNGFQSEFIDAIMEVSSYHVRVQKVSDKKGLEDFLSKNKMVLSFSEFIESESLASSEKGKQAALLVRGLDSDIMQKDSGFKKELRITRGSFDLQKKYLSKDNESLEPIVIGNSLARSLGVRVGDAIELYSISSDRPLVESFTKPKTFVVSGLFITGYADINSSYAFIEKEAAKEFFSGSPMTVGVKLTKSSHDSI